MENDLYQSVKLFTQSGGLVTQGLVPRFHEPPEVITWGERIFIRDDWELQQARPQTDPAWVRYREAWAHTLI